MKKFIKKIEDFVCDNCGAMVKGDGFTNHCPKCLWSKHVDVNPGDREAGCGGMMKPSPLVIKGGEQIISHICLLCGHKKANKVSSQDSFQEILKLSSNDSKGF